MQESEQLLSVLLAIVWAFSFLIKSRKIIQAKNLQQTT